MRGQIFLAATKSEPLKIMISGAPASGKGTQCELIKEKVGREFARLVLVLEFYCRLLVLKYDNSDDRE